MSILENLHLALDTTVDYQSYQVLYVIAFRLPSENIFNLVMDDKIGHYEDPKLRSASGQARCIQHLCGSNTPKPLREMFVRYAACNAAAVLEDLGLEGDGRSLGD